jgi:hypothetical protein
MEQGRKNREKRISPPLIVQFCENLSHLIKHIYTFPKFWVLNTDYILKWLHPCHIWEEEELSNFPVIESIIDCFSLQGTYLFFTELPPPKYYLGYNNPSGNIHSMNGSNWCTFSQINNEVGYSKEGFL